MELKYSGLPIGTFFITSLLSKIGNYIGRSGFGYDPFQPNVLIDGDLTIHSRNGDIKIIETKGHSDDSVSILVDDEIAVVGDVMFGIFKNSIFPPFADDIPKMLASWKTLLETDCKIFLPGHGGEIQRNLLENELIKHIKKFSLSSIIFLLILSMATKEISLLISGRKMKNVNNHIANSRLIPNITYKFIHEI